MQDNHICKQDNCSPHLCFAVGVWFIVGVGPVDGLNVRFCRVYSWVRCGVLVCGCRWAHLVVVYICVGLSVVGGHVSFVTVGCACGWTSMSGKEPGFWLGFVSNVLVTLTVGAAVGDSVDPA